MRRKERDYSSILAQQFHLSGTEVAEVEVAEVVVVEVVVAASAQGALYVRHGGVKARPCKQPAVTDI